MTKEFTGTTIAIMGKEYQIKCSEKEVASLNRAAEYLEEKMLETRHQAGVLSIDRIAVITALNVVHQFLNLESKAASEVNSIQERILKLQNKVETALSPNKQLEFDSAE
jgi:cell division protein ZapA